MIHRSRGRHIAVSLTIASALAVVGSFCHTRSVDAQPFPARATSGDGAIAGAWSGMDWGDIVIMDDGSGSYTDTYGTGRGRLQVRCGRDRRCSGTWGESNVRHGTLAVVLEPDGLTITGSWRPDPQGTIGSTTGGTILWTRR